MGAEAASRARRAGICAAVLAGAALVARALSGGDEGPPQRPISEIERAICTAITALADGNAGSGLSAAEREQLAGFYAIHSRTPLWLDAHGRPTHDATEALAILSGVTDDGLDPAAFGAGALTARSAAIAKARQVDAADHAAFDLDLTATMLRYLRQLHEGRVDPRAIGFRIDSPAGDRRDFPTLLRVGVTAHRLRDIVVALTPPLAQYQELRTELARYRSLGALRDAGTLRPSRLPVREGDTYAGAGDLRRLLLALGDLTTDVPLPGAYAGDVLDGELSSGLRRFQTRHGLEPDGVLGNRTLAALQVPLAWRARQIELGLERLRWLPKLNTDRFLIVNIPMYRLWAVSRQPDGAAHRLAMRVIVGSALDRQTPVFAQDLRAVIFRPYWNLPPSIVRREILPAVERRPNYLELHDMEIVVGPGDAARAVPTTAASLALLGAGTYRVRQRPGPGNALWLVKFVLPNDHNVYLHGTPAPELFSRDRRDFSHGCVRVEQPVALAEWALEGEAGWTRERIEAAMHGSQTVTVNLSDPIQVLLFYVTAAVMPEDGLLHFAEDVYGHDATLDRALAAERPQAPASSRPPDGLAPVRDRG